MFDNFTDSTKELIYEAQNTAITNHNTMIEPVHILNAMAQSPSGVISMLFQELKLNSNLFQSDIKNLVNNLAKTTDIGNQLYFSKTCLKLFEDASQKAKELKDKFVSPEHLLLALMNIQDNDLKRITEKYQLNDIKILTAMKNIS